MPYLFEDKRDWYQANVIAQIDDTDVRRVAEVLNMHYGEENPVEIEPGCLAVWGRYGGKDSAENRKWREICEMLTTVYHFPVGSTSGKAGYWRARPEEIQRIKIELGGRITATQKRLDAYDLALFPPDEPIIPAPAVFQQAKQASFF